MGTYVKAVTEEIKGLLESGLKVTYNGFEIMSENDIEEGLLREDDCSMRDYITDEEGHYIQVNYDLITEV